MQWAKHIAPSTCESQSLWPGLIMLRALPMQSPKLDSLL